MSSPLPKTHSIGSRVIALLGSMASFGGIGSIGNALRDFRLVNKTVSFMRQVQRKGLRGRQHPGTYVGCRPNKFAHMTRQRIRAEAKDLITADVQQKFQLPRRVLRAIVRTRVNREWRQFGTVERAVRKPREAAC